MINIFKKLRELGRKSPEKKPEQALSPEELLAESRRGTYPLTLDAQHHFVLQNGNLVKSLEELVPHLEAMDEATFSHYVTLHKNDFATWINDSLKDKQLALDIGHIKSRVEMIRVITERIKGETKGDSKEVPKAETPSETKKEVTAETEIAPATETKTEIKGAPKIETKAETKTEIKTETKPIPKATPKREIKAEVKAETAIEIKKEPKKETTTVQQTNPLQEIRQMITHCLELVDQKKFGDAKAMYGKVSTAYKDLAAPLKKEIFKDAGALQRAFAAAQKEQKSSPPSDKKQSTPETGKVDLKKMSVKEILLALDLMDTSTEFVAVEEEKAKKKAERRGLKTGVPGFDDMIPTGIPQGSAILVSGGPGSGKTTFCIQMLGWAAERGEKCLFMTFEESEDRLIEHMESYGFDPQKYIEQGTLMVQKMDPIKISRIIEALLAHGRGELVIDINEILDIMPEGFKPDRVVIDSLSAVASAFSESDTAYRIYVNQLINILERTGATSFLISEVQGVEKIGHGLVEEFLTDGVIVFYNLQKGNIKQNAVEILKVRAADHVKKIVPFEFAKGKGIIVYPLERVFM